MAVGGAPVEGDPGIAQRAEGHSHRHAIDLVVDDLVPRQVADRIGARFAAVQFQRDHRLGSGDAIFVAGANELRVA